MFTHWFRMHWVKVWIVGNNRGMNWLVRIDSPNVSTSGSAFVSGSANPQETSSEIPTFRTKENPGSVWATPTTQQKGRPCWSPQPLWRTRVTRCTELTNPVLRGHCCSCINLHFDLLTKTEVHSPSNNHHELTTIYQHNIIGIQWFKTSPTEDHLNMKHRNSSCR